MARHYVPAIADIDNDGGFFTMLDITDPTQITEGRGGDPPTFDTILGVHDVKIIEINDIPYALAALANDHGFQIIDMSDPYSPIPVAGVTNGHGGFNTLGSPWSVDAAKIGDRYYALVTASGIGLREQLNNGIQIIDITNLAHPRPTASVTRATEGFGGVVRFNDIAVTEIGGHHYALMEDRDTSVYIINVTEPRFPKYVSSATERHGRLRVRRNLQNHCN